MNIMLACHAGMSTSLIVENMKQAALDANKDYKIWAVDQTMIQENLGKFDVLLLAPQVIHIRRKVEAIVDGKAIIGVIPGLLYGRLDGKGILEYVEKLIKEGN